MPIKLSVVRSSNNWSYVALSSVEQAVACGIQQAIQFYKQREIDEGIKHALAKSDHEEKYYENNISKTEQRITEIQALYYDVKILAKQIPVEKLKDHLEYKNIRGLECFTIIFYKDKNKAENIAFLQVSLYVYEKHRILYLAEINVEENYQNSGYGAILINAFNSLGDEIADCQLLNVSSQKLSAAQFYIRNGYHVTASAEKAIKEGEQNGGPTRDQVLNCSANQVDLRMSRTSFFHRKLDALLSRAESSHPTPTS